VIPDGRPVRVTAIGPEYEPLFTETESGIFCWPGKMVRDDGVVVTVNV
jgi:hypothetical protein